MLIYIVVCTVDYGDRFEILGAYEDEKLAEIVKEANPTARIVSIQLESRRLV